MASRLISGRVHCQAISRDFRGIVRVQLLDTTRADASSVLVAEEIIRDPLARLQGGTDLEFRIPMPEKLPIGATYTLRAHVDADATGTVKPGDQVTVQSYPVSLHDIDRPHPLQVQRIE